MPLPVRHLPVLQNWDCHLCGQCCKEYSVNVTAEERKRIEDQGWAKRPEYAGVKLVVRDGFLSDRFRLNHRADGSCVFLDERGHCRIHDEFGGTHKPLACQVYPYVLVPAGDHWRVGVRFACPSASANKGRAVREQMADIAGYARQLEEREGIRGRSMRRPRLHWLQTVSNWDDLARIVNALAGMIDDSSKPLEFRWRWVLTVADLCGKTRFDKVTGGRIDELFRMLAPALHEIVPLQEEPPSSMGRVLFRLMAAVYCRRDTGPRRGTAQRNRLALLRAAWRFTRGQGVVPKLHALLPEVTFEQLEVPAGELPPEATALLTRYYRTKLESFQFFGPIHFQYRVWAGLEALALTLPITLWLSRAFCDRPRTAAIETALQIVDDNFGYNALLGSRRHKWMTWLIGNEGHLPKLIQWYAR